MQIKFSVMVLRTKTTFCNSAVVSLNKSQWNVRRDVNIYRKKRSCKTSSVLTFFFPAKQHLILKSLVLRPICREMSPCTEGSWLRQKTVWTLGGYRGNQGLPLRSALSLSLLVGGRCQFLPCRSPSFFLVVPREASSAPAYICGSSHGAPKKAGHNSSCLAPFERGQEWGSGLRPQLAPRVYV